MARRWLLAMLFAASCGPIGYVNDVTRNAADAVAEARAAEAETYAPYYWTRAVAYLREARAIAAHADYQGATRFGRLAAEAARQATEHARRAKQDPSLRPIDPRGTAPAKDDDAAPAPAPAKSRRVAPAKDAP